MPSWLLLVFVTFVWFLMVGVTVTQYAVEDAKRGIPVNQRRGVSWLPGIPIFPLMFWGVAWVVDQFVEPWGTWTIGGFHAVIGGLCVISIGRNVWRLWSMEKST